MKNKFEIKDVFNSLKRNWSDFNYYDIYPGFEEEPGEEECMFQTKKQAFKYAEEVVDIFNSFPDYFPIYRAIKVKSPDDIEKDYLGESWTFDLSAAKEFGSHNGSNYILASFINSDNVDWQESLNRYVVFSSMGDSESEFEIVVYDTDKLLDKLHIFKIKEAKEIGKNPIFTSINKINESILRKKIRKIISDGMEFYIDYFKKEDHITQLIKSFDNPNDLKGFCDTISEKFANKLLEQGIKNVSLIEGVGLKQGLDKNAADAWNEYEPKYLSHVVVRVGNKIIDLTGKQFGDKYSKNIIPLSEFKSYWNKVRVFKTFS